MTDLHKIKDLLNSGLNENRALAEILIESQQIEIDFSPYLKLDQWLYLFTDTYGKSNYLDSGFGAWARVLDVTGISFKSDIRSSLNVAKQKGIDPELPQEFCLLENLNYMDISHADIDTLSKVITQLPALKEIRLSKKSLNAVPEIIYEIKKLKKLFLRNCSIGHIPEKIENLENLEILYLDNNPLNELPIKAISRLKKLKELSVHYTQISESNLSEIQQKIKGLKIFSKFSDPDGSLYLF